MSVKKEILQKLCYTELVYGRINKKLKTQLSKPDIEKMIRVALVETSESNFQKKGKNYYVTNHTRELRMTINSYTFRIITVDNLSRIK